MSLDQAIVYADTGLLERRALRDKIADIIVDIDTLLTGKSLLKPQPEEAAAAEKKKD